MSTPHPPDRPPTRRATSGLMLLVALYALLAASYFVLRYDGRWSDSDTTSLTRAISAMQAREGLQGPGETYGMGFSYQSVSNVLLAATGLPVLELQFWIYPLLAAAVSLVAFAAYRQLAGGAVAGALATLLLFMQPDFLFVMFRGSHEKVTWLAALLALYLLARSFAVADRLARFAPYVVLFYLATFGLFASNAFFGSSFVIAITFSLLAGLILLRLTQAEAVAAGTRPAAVRLLYVLLASLVLWSVLVFWLYEPAKRIFVELNRTTDRAAVVALGQEPRFNPYETVGVGWVSWLAYSALIAPSWLVGGVAFLIWARRGWRLLRGRLDPLPAPQLLAWLIFGGFGTQMAASVVLDQVGAVGGNLQQRLFPAVMIAAFPLAAGALVQFWRRLARGRARSMLALALAAFVLWMGAASLLKATNDPSVGNYWIFWTAPEDRAADWADANLEYGSVWFGLDGVRLRSHVDTYGFGQTSANRSDAWIVDSPTRYFTISEVEELVAVRRGIPLPDVRGESFVYDNGEVQVVHLRPRTPYQR